MQNHMPKISLEFTSPSNPIAEQKIYRAVSVLKHYEIDFACMNFGGDIIAPDRAQKIALKLHTQYHLPVIGYLRRSNVDYHKINQITQNYIQNNINTIFITEGRRLSKSSIETNHYASLIQAVEALKKDSGLKIIVETRPEHTGTEMDMIKSLIDLGIDGIITRFSFNPHITLKFLDKIAHTHTLPPVRIGILPFENPSKTFLTAHRLNVAIPNDIQRMFSKYPDDDLINISLGMHLLLQQTQQYLNLGYDHFHIRFGRSHTPIEALCRYYDIPYHQPCDTLKNLFFQSQA